MRALAGLWIIGAVAACTTDPLDHDRAIAIALVAPVSSDVLGGIADSFSRVFAAAVEEINAKGGIEGRPLVAVVVDSAGDADAVPAAITEAVEVHGAVALVGPATSGEVTRAVDIVRMREVPLISPSATSPALSLPSVADDGFMFRNVPDDGIQGRAAALYLRDYESPAIDEVAVVYENGTYGAGLLSEFKRAFEAKGGRVTAEIGFTTGLITTSAADPIIDELVANGAPMTLLIAIESDAVSITTAWSQSGAAPAMRWFLTDGARTQKFLADAPAAMIGSCGTAASFPVNGLAYSALKQAYESRETDSLEAQVYAPNVWDAVYLFALGMVQQVNRYPGEAVGGRHLRDALTEVSTGGQVFRADQWRNMVGAIRRGGDVDYDGAAGPNDFDSLGQAVGPYEVWCIRQDGAARTFSQEQFLEANQI
jgi:ABC-type branched-subunit amino acid transport system substrate-binding protein